jgi:hypothetical protein
MRKPNLPLIHVKLRRVIGLASLLTGLMIPLFSVAEVTEFTLPDEDITSIRVNGLNVYHVRLPIEAISQPLDAVFHYNIRLGIPVSCLDEALCEVNLYACESPFTTLPDSIDWRYSQNTILSGEDLQMIQLDLKQILVESIDAGFQSIDVLVGQLREEPLGNCKIWHPSEGTESWKITVTVTRR